MSVSNITSLLYKANMSKGGYNAYFPTEVLANIYLFKHILRPFQNLNEHFLQNDTVFDQGLLYNFSQLVQAGDVW